MTPPEPEEGFRVTDRRRRPDEESASPGSVGDARAAPAPPPPGPAEAASPPERSLVGLFVMLGSSAMMALGEAADPMTGQRHVDLGHAAELVDLLLLLRDRTEGHRTPEETQLLDELIYDLQVRYVSAMKRAAPSPGRARP